MARIHWEKEDRIELEKSFAANPHPNSIEKQLIADQLRVPIEKINNFFKNKRQKLRRSGIAIKRVFHDDSLAQFNKSRRAKTMSAKSPPSANHTKPALAPIKLEDISTSPGGQPAMTTQRTPVIKIEKDEDPDYYPDESCETVLSTTESGNVTNDSAEPSSISAEPPALQRIEFNQNFTPRAPIQSLLQFTPFHQTRYTSSTPIIPTYLPIQSPFIESVPSCLDSTAIQYFPINKKSKETAAADIRIEHEKNLDQILEENLNQLNESEDTGIEDTGFEALSEPEPEIEIKPLPTWFPFSVLYPNQPIFQHHATFPQEHQPNYFHQSIYQKYMNF